MGEQRLEFGECQGELRTGVDGVCKHWSFRLQKVAVAAAAAAAAATAAAAAAAAITADTAAATAAAAAALEKTVKRVMNTICTVRKNV